MTRSPVVAMRTLSDNFSWHEASRSATAARAGVPNQIPGHLVPAIQYSAAMMERVRLVLQTPIVVTSWYRSPEVNRLVGSHPGSAHLFGGAVDFVAPTYSIRQAYDILRRSDIPYDQLIIERDREGHEWIHGGWIRPARREALLAQWKTALKRMVFTRVAEG